MFNSNKLFNKQKQTLFLFVCLFNSLLLHEDVKYLNEAKKRQGSEQLNMDN